MGIVNRHGGVHCGGVKILWRFASPFDNQLVSKELETGEILAPRPPAISFEGGGVVLSYLLTVCQSDYLSAYLYLLACPCISLFIELLVHQSICLTGEIAD